MRKVIFLMLFVQFFTMSLTAEEEKGGGNLMLGVESSVIGYDLQLVGEDDEIDKNHTVYFLFGSPKFGINLGYKFSDSSLFGLNFGIGFGHVYVDESDGDTEKNNALKFKLSPFFEYIFSDSKVQPFIKISFDVIIDRVGDYDDNEVLQWYLGATLGGGAHFFLAPSFSIDLSGSIMFSGGEVQLNSSTNDNATPVKNLNIGANVGFTGWI